MGGSSCKPSDLKGNRPQSKEKLEKRKRQLITDIGGYVFKIQIDFRNWGRSPDYYLKDDAVKYLDLIQVKAARLGRILKALNSDQSCFSLIYLANRIKGIITFVGMVIDDVESHFKILKREVKRLEKDVVGR